MLTEGRVYGGGLHKLEPKELAKVPAIELAEHFPEIRKHLQTTINSTWVNKYRQ
jgi:hypothetical protein